MLLYHSNPQILNSSKMTMQTRIILVGGFLGAGKTTLIWRVAEKLMSQGKGVGLITNEQAPELVDSELLRRQNLAVSEVAGSCFCCNFNGFTDAVGGWFWVYILAPFVGAALAALSFRYLLEPLLVSKNKEDNQCCCGKK